LKRFSSISLYLSVGFADHSVPGHLLIYNGFAFWIDIHHGFY